MLTTRVVGRVHVRSRPVGGGWIEFYPTDGTVGNLRSARIRPDGSFEADRVAIGTNAIKLVNPPPGVLELLPQGAVFKIHPRIRRDITTTPVTTLDIDLQDEWLRLRRSSQPG
ncbi:MAG TPA: hypothetical protein VGZ22_00425 [Isosphaeraceae bacterium]|jgi:hypothetical protein|nr:hypothetical protein [Isosphaeraceae bacterium]